MKPQYSRFIALDVFRGLAIALMILVNTPGDWGHVYSPLLHSDWHGFTPTDAVFPFFLFIVGASAFFAFSKSGFELNSGTVLKIFRRSAIMFLIGLALNTYNYLLLAGDSIRVMGVLQRIAICYCLGSYLILTCRGRMIYLISALILVCYYLLFILYGGSTPFELENNIIARVDITVLGAAHMWSLAGGIPFDPEGLLSTLPAIVTFILGFATAKQLSRQPDVKVAAVRLVSYGLLLIVSGCALSVLMPINKNIWSVSFVLFTGGLALIMLALGVYLSDIRKVWLIYKPLQIYGTNPLLIYCVSWLLATAMMSTSLGMVISPEFAGELSNTSVYSALWQFLSIIMPAKLASLVFAFAHVSLFWLISFILYRKNIIVKI